MTMKNYQSWFGAVIITVALVLAWLIYEKILGAGSNFVGGVNSGEPVKGNYLGVMYKGGPLVVVLIAFQIILLAYAAERLLTLRRAYGRIKTQAFVMQVRNLLKQGKWDEIIALCDSQRGSLGNVVKSALSAFKTWSHSHPEASQAEKIAWIETELEEATQLEIPILQKNMLVISTLAQISTLIGLLGTVTGMIIAFASMARVGAPDAVGLANGISQALVTTALGIPTAALGIVLYNYLANEIEQIIYSIDEVNFTIAQYFKLQKV
jgi:biopolymer transport protein ExbB